MAMVNLGTHPRGADIDLVGIDEEGQALRIRASFGGDPIPWGDEDWPLPRCQLRHRGTKTSRSVEVTEFGPDTSDGYLVPHIDHDVSEDMADGRWVGDFRGVTPNGVTYSKLFEFHIAATSTRAEEPDEDEEPEP